jgi:hypothetical protein
MLITAIPAPANSHRGKLSRKDPRLSSSARPLRQEQITTAFSRLALGPGSLYVIKVSWLPRFERTLFLP